MNQEWENPFSIGTNENNDTIIKLGGQLASKRTFDNIEEAQKYIENYNSLVRLGDSMQLACATVIAEKVNDKGTSEMYRVAYES